MAKSDTSITLKFPSIHWFVALKLNTPAIRCAVFDALINYMSLGVIPTDPIIKFYTMSIIFDEYESRVANIKEVTSAQIHKVSRINHLI